MLLHKNLQNILYFFLFSCNGKLFIFNYRYLKVSSYGLRKLLFIRNKCVNFVLSE